MRHQLPVLAAALALTLAGCASVSPTPAATTAPSAEATAPATPSPTPTVAPHLVLGVDGLALASGEGSESAEYDDGESLVALIAQIAGEPMVEEFEGPYGSEGGLRHTWEGVTLLVFSYDDSAFLTVESPSVGGIPVTTTDGVTVGDSRDTALAAGAFELCPYDGDDDGKSDSLAVEPEDVADATSLCRDDHPGVLFVDIGFSGDTVSRLSAPANDFSDI